MYSDVRFTYLFLQAYMLIVFVVIGGMMSKAKDTKTYWRLAIVVILSYGLVSGLRWGREIDWNFYAKRYYEIGEGISNDNYELLFSSICYSFYNLGIPYWLFIFIQCLFLMYSICLLFKDYRKEVLFIFLLLPYLIKSNENLIRWYLAYTFILLAFYYVMRNRYFVTICFLSCAVLTHVGSLVITPVFLFRNILNKRILSEKIWLILLSVIFFASVSYMSVIVDLSRFALSLGLGNIDPRLNTYLELSDSVVNGDFGILGIGVRSATNQLRYFIAFSPIIYFAPRYLDKYKYGFYLYNITAIGAITEPVLSLVEILGRFSEALLFFSCIVGGITYYNIFKSSRTSLILKVTCMLSILCSIWPLISYVLSREGLYDMTYVWDVNGKDYLSVE